MTSTSLDLFFSFSDILEWNIFGFFKVNVCITGGWKPFCYWLDELSDFPGSSSVNSFLFPHVRTETPRRSFYSSPGQQMPSRLFKSTRLVLSSFSYLQSVYYCILVYPLFFMSATICYNVCKIQIKLLKPISNMYCFMLKGNLGIFQPGSYFFIFLCLSV